MIYHIYLKIVHHFGKGQPGGGHCDATVAAALHAAVIIGVRLIARVTDYIYFICNHKTKKAYK